MAEKSSKISFTGIALGGIALLMALIHFYAGPFTQQPTIEETVAEKAVAIRDATVAALKGEKVENKAVTEKRMDNDKILQIATAVLGGLAIILGVIGYARQEPTRAASGAAILGGGAIAYQFSVIAIGAIVFAILVAAVLSNTGLDL